MSSELIEKRSCPLCPSSDAFAVYDDGHGFCYSCNGHVAQVDPFEEGQSQPQQPRANNVSEFVTGSYIDLADRRLYERTLKKFRYTVSEGNHYAPYFDNNGNYVAQKVRSPDKSFYVIGDLAKAGLFGQQLWAPGQRLVITEGELDAMSYAQVTGLTWQVVSVPNGAQGAAKAIRRELEFVESFEEVVFLFDQDEHGKKAAEECAALLRPGLAKIAQLPMKDASEMLMSGKEAELKAAVYAAVPFRPDGIKRGHEVDFTEIIKATPKGFDIPYSGINSALRGIRKGELILLTAGSGIGKSTLAREVGYHMIREHRQRVGWVMLEESYRKTIQGLVAIDNNIPLGDLMEKPTILEQPDWDKSMAELICLSDFYDSWGSCDVDTLMTKLRYLAIGCECDFIVLDHVSMVVSGLEVEERKTLDMLMTNLRQFVEQTGVGLIAVSHLRRNSGKDSFNEGGKVSLTDLRGSAGLEQLSDVVIASERNQQADDDQQQDITSFRILKNRPFGVVGPAGQAQYARPTGRLLPYDASFDSQNIDDIPF
jgi:twinkle protein